MADASFLERTNERTLPAEWSGDIYVWDIDKTYLDTRFSSLRGLLSIPFELAIDKRALPGTVALLRGLRHGADEESNIAPIYFISGSPKHLRGIVERKMTLDGVQFDGITFKDQLGLLRARRPKGITEQVGYKLKALLLYRREHPRGARYTLFGDDVERDVDSFLLFGEVCAGLRGPALRDRLQSMGVHDVDVHEAASIADTIPVESDPVQRVFIHEVRGGRIKSSDPRVLAAPNFLEHARVLRDLGKIRQSDVDAVALEVAARGRA
jgi:hypothetical protein